MTKISIIIPIYNAEAYLEKCLDSVSQQIFTDFEAILIDDGSKDSSGRICDEFALKDPRFKVMHKENGGVALARNTGLENASGEWIAFVDSDDTVNPEYLSEMINLVDSNTDLVLCDLLGREKHNLASVRLTPELFDEHPLLSAGYPYNKLYRLDIIRRQRIQFSEGISTMEDNIFVWNYMIYCTTISICKHSNYLYNRHQNSLVRSVHKVQEIHKLCVSILPVYNNLLSRFHLRKETIYRIDNYLFVSCIKRLLISNCRGLSYKQLQNLLLDICKSFNSLLCRFSETPKASFADSILSFLLIHRCVYTLSLFVVINNLIKHYKN